jgi:ankyrin repeat protein
MTKFRTVDEVLDAVRESSVEFGNYEVRPGVNATGFFGSTPLFPAITWGDLDAVKLLIAAGADVNMPGERSETPLHHAIRMSEFSIARILVAAGADCEARDAEGKAPRDCCWEGEWPSLFGTPPPSA